MLIATVSAAYNPKASFARMHLFRSLCHGSKSIPTWAQVARTAGQPDAAIPAGRTTSAASERRRVPGLVGGRCSVADIVTLHSRVDLRDLRLQIQKTQRQGG